MGSNDEGASKTRSRLIRRSKADGEPGAVISSEIKGQENIVVGPPDDGEVKPTLPIANDRITSISEKSGVKVDLVTPSSDQVSAAGNPPRRRFLGGFLQRGRTPASIPVYGKTATGDVSELVDTAKNRSAENDQNASNRILSGSLDFMRTDPVKNIPRPIRLDRVTIETMPELHAIGNVTSATGLRLDSSEGVTIRCGSHHVNRENFYFGLDGKWMHRQLGSILE